MAVTGGHTLSDSATERFGLGPIGQIAVPVGNIERAIAFYRDVLGMQFLSQAPPGLGFFDCAGVRLMLDAPVKTQAGNHGSVIYYRVSDIHAAFATFVSKASLTSSRGCPTTNCGWHFSAIRMKTFSR